LLLLLICWQMWRDLRGHRFRARSDDTLETPTQGKTLLAALLQIFIADVSTSMDNVLAVVGAVRNQPAWLLFIGLGLSVVLTGLAATLVARLLRRWPWIGYFGLAIVLFVSGHMIWDGVMELGWLRRLDI
jgi:predicted tellurium resistance membrane protein TerC